MKRTKKVIFTLILLVSVCLAFSACSVNADMVPPRDNGYGGDSYEKEDGMLGGVTGGGDLVLDADRKIIKTVNESVQTESYDIFLDSLREKVSTLGGYVTSANYRGDSYYGQNNLRQATLTLRIPVEKLAELTDAVSGLGVVTYYNESADDVTAAYVDVESRIAVLSAEETALLEILAKAETVSDALEIRTRLNTVQSDLASLRAQKNSYDTLTAYSTVYLTVYEVRRAESTDPTFFEEVGYNFSDSLDSIGEGLRAFAVWLLGDIIYILLVAGLLTGGFFVVRFVIRRRRAGRIAESAAAERKAEAPTETPTEADGEKSE